MEQALEQGSEAALQTALRRDLLMHGAMAFFKGFPMLNSGDEIGQLNGWGYKNDPDLAEDSRNLHRTRFNWDNAAKRSEPGTLQNELWQGLEALRELRSDPCFGPDAWFTTWDTHNNGVLGLVRRLDSGRTLAGVFNFTAEPQHLWLDALDGAYRDRRTGAAADVRDLWLQPYEMRVLVNE